MSAHTNRVDLKRFTLDALNTLLDATLLAQGGLYSVREITDEVMRRTAEESKPEDLGSVALYQGSVK